MRDIEATHEGGSTWFGRSCAKPRGGLLSGACKSDKIPPGIAVNQLLAPYGVVFALWDSAVAALSASVILEGLAVLQQTFLHTYVQSSCGASWGCWGGSTGGTSVCSGSGSSIEADCISQGGAGILYGLNGVCHQTANRILAPANVNIPPSYQQLRVTYLTYGRYGYNLPNQPQSDCWPDRRLACSGPGGASVSAAGHSGPSGPSSGSTRLYRFSTGRMNVATFTIAGQDPPDPRSELSSLIRDSLGHPVDRRIFNGLADMQAKLQSQQRELVRLLLAKEIDKDVYISRLDDALKTATRDGERLLGADDFHKVFGELRVQNIIDPSAFYGAY